MANAAVFDDKAVQAALSRLNGDLRTQLARSMGVAGGKVFRDTAKALCPVGGDMRAPERQAGESNQPGLLKSSIYLAFKDKMSYGGKVVYGVSWNSKIAPHGHLVEFGHWQPYKVYLGKDGEWYTNTRALRDSPKWIAAQPFLAPAFDGAQAAAKASMLARGKERLPELLREVREK